FKDRGMFYTFTGSRSATFFTSGPRLTEPDKGGTRVVCSGNFLAAGLDRDRDSATQAMFVTGLPKGRADLSKVDE
ncbi:hypothetical protein BaRGS_00010977, partial [Batillaria attramentaria]